MTKLSDSINNDAAEIGLTLIRVPVPNSAYVQQITNIAEVIHFYTSPLNVCYQGLMIK